MKNIYYKLIKDVVNTVVFLLTMIILFGNVRCCEHCGIPSNYDYFI